MVKSGDSLARLWTMFETVCFGRWLCVQLLLFHVNHSCRSLLPHRKMLPNI